MFKASQRVINARFSRRTVSWSFVFLFIGCRSRLHQIIQVRFMPPKRICLQLENLALITRFDAFLSHPIIFIRPQLIFFFSFQRISTSECQTKRLEMNFLFKIKFDKFEDQKKVFTLNLSCVWAQFE